MSMMICGFCNSLIDTDYNCGEWDIESKEGDSYDFVCEDCASDDDNFELNEDL